MVGAVLYLPDSAGHRVASRQVAGRTLAVRAMVASFRAGASIVAVPAVLRDAAVDRALRRMPVLAAAVRWLTPDSAAPRDLPARPWLLVPASALVHARALEGLLAAPRPPQGTVLAASAAGPAPAALAPPALVAALWSRLAAGDPVGGDLAERLRAVGAQPRGASGPYAAVGDEAGLARAEAVLFSALGLEADSAIDRHLHRRCSRWVTRVLVRTPVTPAQISVSSLAVGGAAVWCFWHATPSSALLGLLLHAVACIVDHVDGEVARLTLRESRFGANLDWTIDTVVQSGLVLGMAVTAGGPLMPALGALGVVGVVLSALFAWYLPAEMEAGTGGGGVLKAIGNRDLFYLLLVSFVLLRWLCPPLLVGLAAVVAVGSQAYWMGCAARMRRAGGEWPR